MLGESAEQGSTPPRTWALAWGGVSLSAKMALAKGSQRREGTASATASTPGSFSTAYCS